MKIVWFLGSLIFPFVNSSNSTERKTDAKIGPYRALLVRTEKCDKTTFPLDKDPPLTLTLEVHNTSTSKFLLNGNFTVTRENRQLKLKIKSYKLRNGKWKLNYLMNNIGCRGVLLHMLNVAAGMKYNEETCGYFKGVYVFKDLDIDYIQHIWASKMEYGRMLWTGEMTTGATTIYCWEFETLVEPLNKQ